jgi:hypothetical protein
MTTSLPIDACIDSAMCSAISMVEPCLLAALTRILIALDTSGRTTFAASSPANPRVCSGHQTGPKVLADRDSGGLSGQHWHAPQTPSRSSYSACCLRIDVRPSRREVPSPPRAPRSRGRDPGAHAIAARLNRHTMRGRESGPAARTGSSCMSRGPHQSPRRPGGTRAATTRPASQPGARPPFGG